jgi:hypothetical protein
VGIVTAPDENVAAVERVRALADEWGALGTTSVYESAGELAQILREALTPASDTDHAMNAVLEPTPDNTPPEGYDWRNGLEALDALLSDCAQIGPDYQNFVRVSAVRDIVNAIRRWEDETDESIRSALWEDAVINGEAWTEEQSS